MGKGCGKWFCRVVFGLNASLFLLNATLRHHIETFVENDPVFVQKRKDGFYLDDLVSGGGGGGGGGGEASPTFGHANPNFSVFIDRIRNQFLKK